MSIHRSAASTNRIARELAHAALMAACLVMSATLESRGERPEPMLKVRLGTGVVEGVPLSWSDEHVSILARDGQLITFPPEGATGAEKSARFSAYSPNELRGRLYAEFGHDVHISSTQHYLVVHPQEMTEPWARRFEDLYRSFVHYFKVRGFALREPEYPLVAVVFADRQAYLRYCAAKRMQIPANFRGHYLRHTNRIYLFDVSSEIPTADWTENAATLIHEATHQTAFNTGVHARFSGAPRWLVEGLAMMFESRGVWNSSKFRERSDRINRERLEDFRKHLEHRPAGWFRDLVATDTLFDTNLMRAYAESWALSFYLCETRPRLYAAYLAQTATRPAFQDYTSAQRIADFTAIFGRDFEMLDAQFLRYIADLK